MDKSRLEIFPGVWLDHRRCLFLEQERVLAVADLHLGYAWAHRFHGQMMPLQPDCIQERLLELCASYRPEVIAVLGDVVHAPVPVVEVQNELLQLVQALQAGCRVDLILGNHDRDLQKVAPRHVRFHRSIRAGRFLLAHGHEIVPHRDGTIIIGHEHPAISLGDGVRSAKFPCFLLADNLIVLPAFSAWAAGSDVRTCPPNSPFLARQRSTRAVAILNDKLLPVPLG